MISGGDSKRPSFQFYPKDFLSDENVRAMDYEQIGVYITLLSMEWLEGSIPSDRSRLERLLRFTKSKKSFWWDEILNCFVESSEGRLIHPRLEKERQKQDSYREIASKAGEKGAKKRWGGYGDPISEKKGGYEKPIAENGFPSSSPSSSPINNPLKAGLDKEPSPFKVDLSAIEVGDLDEPAKHKCYNRVIQVFKARGWHTLGEFPLSVFKAVSERVNQAKPKEYFPYFQTALFRYVNENADALSGQSQIERKKAGADRNMGKAIGEVMRGMVAVAMLCIVALPAYAEININAIESIESSGNPKAFNKKSGARGLFQITDICLKDFRSVTKSNWTMADMHDEAKSAHVAVWYLEERIGQLLNERGHKQTLENKLIAWNCGVRCVGKPLPLETRDFIRKYKERKVSK